MNWWPFRKKVDLRDATRMQKVQESQVALLNATTSTTDAAQDVTLLLRGKLDDSLRQLETTSQLLSNALIICDSDGSIQSFNRAAEFIFGWGRKDVIGKNIDFLFRKISGNDIATDEVFDIFSNVCQCADDKIGLEEPIEYLRGKKKSGELIWVDGKITQLDKVDGSYIILLLVRDITNRVEEQHRLQINEHRYRSIFEQSFDGIFVVDNFYITSANPAIERILGYTQEEIVAKPLVTLFPESFQKMIVDKHQMRIGGDLSPKNYAVKAVKKNGEEVELLVSSTGIEWDTGNASLITIKDLTEIRHLEDVKRKHQRHVGNNIDMYIEFNPDLVIQGANQAFLKTHNTSIESVLGKDAFFLSPDDLREGYKKALSALTHQSPTGRLQSTEVCQGITKVQDWLIHAIYDDQGTLVEYHAVGRDITEIVNSLRS